MANLGKELGATREIIQLEGGVETQPGGKCQLELILPQRIIPDPGVQWLQGRGGLRSLASLPHLGV